MSVARAYGFCGNVRGRVAQRGRNTVGEVFGVAMLAIAAVLVVMIVGTLFFLGELLLGLLLLPFRVIAGFSSY